MNSFIDLLIQKLIETKIPFTEMQVVFPTKRACILFKHKFALHFKQPQWLPQTSSIEDFILSLSALEKANDLFLITQLFDVYKKYDSQIEFESFYNWGKILIADFDETDSYLIDQNKLYTTLQNFAEIDNTFGMSDDEWQSLLSFWKSIYNGSPTKIRQHFLNSWQILPNVLHDFKQSLHAAGKVYRGLAYRTVADNIHTQKLNHVIFAGFYALSTAEEYIIKYLLDNNNASMFWDADTYYLNNPIQEAGYYLRNNKLLQERYRHNSTILKTDKGLSFADEKEINLIGIPLKVGQAKFTGNKLKKLIESNQFEAGKTVIVLPDEQLLMPLLHALPFIENINVTMGYPIKHTQVYSWLNIYIQCLQNRSNDSVYFKDDLILIINHPLAGYYLGSKQYELIDRLNTSVTTLIKLDTLNTIAENPLLRLLCMPTTNMHDCVVATTVFIDFILKNLSSKLNNIEHEAILNLQEQLQQQYETVVNNELLSTKSAWILIADMLKNLRIPFEGKASNGLQIMGFLETRVLDFERVILLSANENYLPAAKTSSSYIPYNLRKAFGLPTSENQNAIYAYHFYRLLQRARYVDILYNTELNKTGGGEGSRYLLQIKHELSKINPAIKLTDSIYTTPIQTIKPNAITIYKNAAIENKLKLKYVYTQDNPNQFSASSLSTYINCNLAFYFKYVIEIKTETETTNTIDAATFGNIIHKCLEQLYEPSKHYTKEDVTKLNEQVPNVVENAFNLILEVNTFAGELLLKKITIETLIKKLLQKDAHRTPFKVEANEKKLSTIININQNNIALGGKIDRIDNTTLTTIIDYKSGHLDSATIKPVSIESLFSDAKYKAIFQLQFYTYLLHQNNKDLNINAAFYHIKEMDSGLKFINESKPFEANHYKEFNEHLSILLSEIFDMNIPFAQTDDIKKCAHCSFKSICNR